MNHKAILAITAVILAVSLPARAVTTGADFLKFGIGAKAPGMGEAAVASVDDVTASYWNPAGLASVERRELGIMHSEAITDATLGFAGFALPVQGWGTFSLSGIFYIVKPIPITFEDSTPLGDLNWTDLALALSFGRKVTDRLSVGAGAKLIRRMESDPIFGTSEGMAGALDAGCIYETPVKGLRAGFALLNTGDGLQMSGEKRKDPLPQTTRLGLAYRRALDPQTSFTAAADFSRILDGGWCPGYGAELGFREMLFLRAGYYQKEGNIGGMTYGFGFRLNKLRVDYSSIPASAMVNYSRNSKVSVTVQF